MAAENDCFFKRVSAACLLFAASGMVLASYCTGHIDRFVTTHLLGSIAGLSFGVLHIPGLRTAKPANFAIRCSISVFMILATTALSLVPMEPYKRVMNLLSCISMTVVAVVCLLSKHPRSIYTHDAMWCIVSLWMTSILSTSWALLAILSPGPHSDKASLHWIVVGTAEFCISTSLHLEGVVQVWIAMLMSSRVLPLMVGQSCSDRMLHPFLYVMGFSFQIIMWMTVFDLHSPNVFFTSVFVTCRCLFILIVAGYTTILCRILFRSIRLLQHEVRRVRGAPRAEADWACHVLSMELIACICQGIVTSTSWSLVLWKHVAMLLHRQDSVTPGIILSHRLAIFIDAICTAVFSGILWQARLEDQPESVRDRSGAREMVAEPNQREWNDKVEELAHRAFRLESLLTFWCQLLAGEIMSSFDPRRSTTNDVVRQAIIPLSRLSNGGGQALARVWNSGEAMLAQRMVTHNWSNLFLYCVAGVISDCLGRSSYGEVAEKLLTLDGTTELRQTLPQSALDVRYWVCAISVNQHASICNSVGAPPPLGSSAYAGWLSKACDTVTKRPHPICSCKEPKYFNDERIKCEMNKFDAMMTFLFERVPDFKQVVVVDADFEVFYRAWCVAEIAEGDRLELQQSIKIHSQDSLDLHYDSLSTLDVQACQASREEDKHMILAKIPDIDAFNLRLQEVIFGVHGLFSAWLDGHDRAGLIGRIYRRVHSSSTAKLRSTSSCSDSDSPLSSSDDESSASPNTSCCSRYALIRA